MVVAVEVVFGVELPLARELEPDPPCVLGTTTVTVTCGVVLVTVLEPGLDFVFDPPGLVPVGLVPVGVVPGWNAAYSTVAAGAV